MDQLEYGVIGNGKSAALVSKQGSIRWCCLPDFDSPSVFAALLDENKGGEFAINVGVDYDINQRYAPRTNVLVTTYSHPEGSFELIDFMPRYKTESGCVHCPPDVIRYIHRLSGRPKIRIHYDPRPCYGQFVTKKEVRSEYIKAGTVNGSYESVYLYSDLDLHRIAAGEPIIIERNCYLLFSYNQKLGLLDAQTVELEYEKTHVYWLDWSAKMPRFGRYQEEITRSVLTLKLLAAQETGALVAAITTSLPEVIGGERNWDYRFCWLRDASMIISVMTRLNHYNVARRFMEFVLRVIPFKDEKIQIMYGLKGQKILSERSLKHLSGYEGSRPVRVGNAAYKQKQNDIFGVLLDVIYQYLVIFKRGMQDYHEDVWTIVRSLSRHVENNWQRPDMSLWEFRTRKRHFTFSKVLSWVAMDRAMRIAGLFNKPRYVQVWSRVRERIRADISTHGWNDEIGAFTQSYGDQQLDAANLLMEHYGFIAADDPRYISTVLATQKNLCRDGLMYRYRNEDDFGQPQTSFTICTFWLIKSLYKIGRRDEAKRMFDAVMSYSNHVGLFSEGIHFTTKRLLGNFPQGYSHLSLIDAAMTLCGDEDLTTVAD